MLATGSGLPPRGLELEASASLPVNNGHRDLSLIP